MKRYSFLILIFLGLLSTYSSGQNLRPPIQNFTALDYGAASQNWGVVIDEQGIVYAANSQGLLRYDGQQWKLYPLKNSSILRSVYEHNGRIYTGSYQEFGYWSQDVTGELYYTSLMDLFGELTFQNEEFWEMLSFGEALYFRSFGAIYKYENNIIERVKNVLTNEMLVYQDRLVLAQNQKGLHYLEADAELVPFPKQEILMGKTILDVEVHQDRLFVITREALYVSDDTGTKLYPDPALNELLRKAEPNQVLSSSENELIIGTVRNGLVHYNLSTGAISVINREKGLQNNTVLDMAQKDGMVWLALDNGIDAVSADFPISFYGDASGELGSVYDLAFHEGQLYLATNTGVYSLSEGEIRMVEGTEGHSWGMETIEGKLYINHNTGTYSIEKGELSTISRRTGSFELQKGPGANTFLATYNGLDVLDLAENRIKTISGTGFPIKELVFENENTVWAAHAYKGVYRLGLSPSLDSIDFVKKFSLGEEVEDAKARIYTMNNQITAFINEEWYIYNPFLDSLQVFNEMKDYQNQRLLHKDGLSWFVSSLDNSIKITNFEDINLKITSAMLEHRLVIGNEKVIKQSDSIYYLTLQDGFARIDISNLQRFQEEERVAKPLIQGFRDTKSSYDLTDDLEVPFERARELRLHVGLPVSSGFSSLYYEVTGAQSLQGSVPNGVLQFQNLPHGDYEVRFFGLSSQGKRSKAASLQFQVLPPWYLSGVAKFIYVLLLIGLVTLVFWLNKRKLMKHRLALEEKYRKEHEERKHRLEKESLINEINLKRKELANTTMVAAKKNEVLMEIQGELSKDQNKFTNEYRLKHLMGKINKAIKNNDEWAVFETNFNELHEDFFKDLLATYPELTNKDLKLCSYLRMNLSSKEIAPLMGISVRGVEVHRYRLRKKMKLSGKENLTNFLIANF